MSKRLPSKLKKLLFFYLCLILLGLPLASQAGLQIGWNDVTVTGLGFIGNLAIAFVSLLVIVPIYAILTLFGAAIVVTSWIMEQTMNVPIVHSWARDVGWTFTRDLVNMLFIIILAWIGIATILRLREYRTGKILMNLLFIALLVNFSPVLVGLVVDASNIVANFFISSLVTGNNFDQLIGGPAGGQGIIEEAARAVGRSFGQTVRFWGNFHNNLSNLVIILTYGVFFLVGAFVFGTLAALFIFRVLAFWVLLIVSPFAFICYILPSTQKYWRLWWHNLLQWAFVGATAAFFVALAFSFLEFVQTDPIFGPQNINNPDPQSLTHSLQTTAGGNAFSAAFIGAITALLPLGVALVFMGLAVFAGFSTGAAGASLIIGWSKRKGRAWIGRSLRTGGRWYYRGAKAAGKGVRRGVTKGVEMISPKTAMTLERLSGRLSERVSFEKMATAATWKQRMKDQTAWGKTWRTATHPAFLLARWAGRQGTKIGEAERKEVLAAEKKALERTATQNLSTIRAPLGTLSDKIAALRAAIEKNQIGEMREAGLTDEEIVRLGRKALEIHPELFKKIRDAFPQLAEKMGEGFTEEAKKRGSVILEDKDIEEGYTSVAEKLVAELSPSKIAKLDKGVFDNEEAMKAAHKFWSGREIGAAAREFGRSFTNTFMEEAETKGFEWYKKNNPRVPLYLLSTPAQELGMWPISPKEMKEEDVRRALKEEARVLARRRAEERKKKKEEEEVRRRGPGLEQTGREGLAEPPPEEERRGPGPEQTGEGGLA